jgi:molecular chaperone DnaK
MPNSQAPVLGIDLGTTFSAMSIVNQFGKPEILTNAEGHPTTPSVVHFYDDGACVVGDEAVKMVVVDPTNVVRFIKRHMGEDEFALDFFGHTHTPQEISALILRKLADDASERLGVEVPDAVVTVPAYFNSAQRGATSEAGAIAGLNVLSIINEPTAAAIAYGLDRLGTDRKIMVFDLGGGTFDVTVMHIHGQTLTTLSSDGNAELGGKDWDDRLLNHVAEEFLEKHNADPRDDAVAYQELYERVLHAKISLSTKDRALIPVNYAGRRAAMKVTRSTFEALTRDLVDQCADTCEIVLDKAHLAWPDLDDVLLVGGSTRMPMVRDLLRRTSGRDASDAVNPDECVAMGAALAGVLRHRPDHPSRHTSRPAVSTSVPPRRPRQNTPPNPDRPEVTQEAPRRGAVIGMAYGGHVAIEGAKASALPDVQIEDVTTHPLGIVVLDRNRDERVYELIPEGTALPHEYSGRFAYAYDNMTAVRVEVTEGAGRSREEVTVIGKVELRDLPPRPKGTPIEVVYSYGVDQILSVRVVDVQTGHAREAHIKFQGGMSHRELAEARGRTRGMLVD